MARPCSRQAPKPRRQCLHGRAEPFRTVPVEGARGGRDHHPFAFSICSGRTFGCDPGPVFDTALLDPAADPNAATGQSLQIKTCRRECALVSFRDRNCNILRPSPSEIYINRGAAFTYGRHRTFDQRESASLRRYIHRGLDVNNVIIRIRPQAKPGLSGGLFAGQKFPSACVPDPVTDAGKTVRYELPLDKKLVAIAHCVGIGDEASITIGRDLGAAKDDLIAAGQRVERGGSGFAVRRLARVVRRRQWRNLDRRQANFASVLEGESAPVYDAADRAAGDLIAAASMRRLLLTRARRRVAKHCRKTGRNHRCQNAVQDPVSPKRHALERKAGMRRYCDRALTRARHKQCQNADRRA